MQFKDLVVEVQELVAEHAGPREARSLARVFNSVDLRSAVDRTTFRHLDVGGASLRAFTEKPANLDRIARHTTEISLCLDLAADIAIPCLINILDSLTPRARAINLRISTGSLPTKMTEAKVIIEGVDAALRRLDSGDRISRDLPALEARTIRLVFIQGNTTIASTKKKEAHVLVQRLAFSVLLRRIMTLSFVRRLEIATNNVCHPLGWVTSAPLSLPLNTAEGPTIEELECRVDVSRLFLGAGLPLKRVSFHSTNDFMRMTDETLLHFRPADHPDILGLTTLDVFLEHPPRSFYRTELSRYIQILAFIVPSKLHRLNLFAEEAGVARKAKDEDGWGGLMGGIITTDGRFGQDFRSALEFLAETRPGLLVDEWCFWDVARTGDAPPPTGTHTNLVDEQGQALVEEQLRAILPNNPSMRVLFDSRPRLSTRVVELYQ